MFTFGRQIAYQILFWIILCIPNIYSIGVDEDVKASSLGHRAMEIIGVLLLVMLGGVYAGLTIGLMSLDETSLQIIKNSGTPQQQKYANMLIPMRKNGYLLLVTLLLANTIVNESLPIVADSFYGSGWFAILISTILVLCFGEILPQAICTKHALTIGGKLVPLLKFSLVIMFPIAYPISRLLEKILGKAESVLYKRNELKELVSLMGVKNLELNAQEVRMIRGVLDLRDKHPALIMTPIDQVFKLSLSAVLDPAKIKEILERGFSRIPIYEPHQETRFVGVLLVKNLLSLNLISPTPLSTLPLHPIPSFWSNVSLFSILNEFQRGSSHIGVVKSADDGNPIGVITMEDIFEEILQEDIIDETDFQSTTKLGPYCVRIDPLISNSHRRVSTDL